MAAAKNENLSLVVHGPGDLRLVKREGEWEPSRTLSHWLWSPAAGQLANSSPNSSAAPALQLMGPGHSDSSWRLASDPKSRVLVTCLPEPSPRPARGWRLGSFRDD